MPHAVDFSPLQGHTKTALMFSCGKDSLALDYLVLEHWPRLMRYPVDTGDLLPETREIVAAIEAMFAKFLCIETNAPVDRSKRHA